jgi:hypothetical protein
LAQAGLRRNPRHTITIFADWYAQALIEVEPTLAELAMEIRRNDAEVREGLPWLKLARFGDQRSAAGSLRHDANVVAITGVETDYDGEQLAFDEAVEILKQAKVEAILYTSPSHRDDKPRWRILAPTSQELPPEERTKLVARLNGLFGGILARESFVLSQAYYYGSVGENPAHRAILLRGDYIDRRADLDAKAIYVEPKPRSGQKQPKQSAARAARATKPFPSGAVDTELADAMQFVPNHNLDWVEWNAIGMALWAASKGSQQGYELFAAFSKQSHKYDADYTRQRWWEISGSPPNRTGAGKLFKIARKHGWVPTLYAQKATYASEGGVIKAAQRELIRKIVRDFLHTLVEPDKHRKLSESDDGEEWLPLVQALRMVTGGGKTGILIEEMANFRQQYGREHTPIIYAVPQHRLSKEIVERFKKLGVDARIFRGFLAKDPDHPGQLMCLTPERVKKATEIHASIAKTVCRTGAAECPFRKCCAYWRQWPEPGDEPDVWIVAADMLFLTHPVFKNAKAVIIDESFWQKGLRGTDDNDPVTIPLAVLQMSEQERSTPADPTDASQLDSWWCKFWRERLAQRLNEQPNDGYVQRRYLEGNRFYCQMAIKQEWIEVRRKSKLLGLYPGMAAKQFADLAPKQELVEEIKRHRQMITIWTEVERMTHLGPERRTARLRLGRKNGLRMLSWRGVEPVHKPYIQQPTLLIDAVLPDKKILEVYYPSVELVADINAGTDPKHVHIKQILGAPTSKKKLSDGKHREEVKRYILAEWMRNSKGKTLVICQKDYHQWLRKRETKFPKSIHVEHYNDIAGVDGYKDVELLIMIGGTRPQVQQVENIAGALTGEVPIEVAADKNGDFHYDEVRHGIRRRHGDIGVRTIGYQHPDPVGQQVKWQIWEGEQLNAWGRARAINRGPDTPKLKARLLFDNCLPITVDVVERWKTESLLIAAALEGLLTSSPQHLCAMWPKVFPSLRTAERAMQGGLPQLPGFVPFYYQLKGARQKPVLATYDPTVVADPLKWVQKKLKRPLAGGGTS